MVIKIECRYFRFGIWAVLFVFCVLNKTYANEGDSQHAQKGKTYQTRSQLTAVHLQGVVLPAQQTKISFVESGLIKQIVSMGSEVNSNDVIAILDDTKLKIELAKSNAQLRAAASQLHAAEHERDKSARLVNDQVLSEIAMTEAEFGVTTAKENWLVAKAQVNLVEQQIANCTLNAPYNGVVMIKNFNQGEWVNAGDPVVEFVNLDKLSLSIDVPPIARKTIKLGLKTSVLINNKQVGMATVKMIFPTVEPTSGLLRVVWDIKADDHYALSGRYVSLAAWDQI